MPRSPSRHGVDPSEAIAITAPHCVISSGHTPRFSTPCTPQSRRRTAKAPNAAPAATAYVGVAGPAVPIAEPRTTGLQILIDLPILSG
jgi:hypothetical protein